jgi:hypothetical protein
VFLVSRIRCVFSITTLLVNTQGTRRVIKPTDFGNSSWQKASDQRTTYITVVMHGDLFHAPDVVAEVTSKKFGVQIVDDLVKISTNG